VSFIDTNDVSQYPSFMAASRRLNLTLPAPLSEGLRRQASRRGTKLPELARGLLREGLRQLERDALEAELRRAYRELASEERRLMREFRSVDLEGWE
jgi:hypothetical protein